jgi:hypothetical protein
MEVKDLKKETNKEFGAQDVNNGANINVIFFIKNRLASSFPV